MKGTDQNKHALNFRRSYILPVIRALTGYEPPKDAVNFIAPTEDDGSVFLWNNALAQVHAPVH